MSTASGVETRRCTTERRSQTRSEMRRVAATRASDVAIDSSCDSAFGSIARPAHRPKLRRIVIQRVPINVIDRICNPLTRPSSTRRTARTPTQVVVATQDLRAQRRPVALIRLMLGAIATLADQRSAAGRQTALSQTAPCGPYLGPSVAAGTARIDSKYAISRDSRAAQYFS